MQFARILLGCNPNERFRSPLAKHADTWRLVQREAAGNVLKVEVRRGKVLKDYPLVISVDARERAECEITGGIGYVPLTFTGLRDYRGFELLADGIPVNQSVHGNDFWQTDYDPVAQRWRVTYNLSRDTAPATRLAFRRR